MVDDRSIDAAIPESPPQLQRFAASLRELAARRDTDETLQFAVDLATELIGGVDVADIMFVRPGGVTTPVSTDPVAEQLDQAQQKAEAGGPCLNTLVDDHDRIVSQDLSQDERWPEFSQVALEQGFRSAAAYRLFVHHGEGESRLGALNLFGREPGLSQLSVDLGEVFAVHCSAVLDAAINAEGLERALQSRDTIGQAKGILMERHRIGAADAYTMLREASNQGNVKLHELARQVTETGLLQTP